MSEKTILAEQGERLLVKVVTEREFNGKTITTERYELWRNKEKFHQNVITEYINEKQFIYCSNFAGGKEEQLIKQFNDNLLK
jgi:hypothetical protein